MGGEIGQRHEWNPNSEMEWPLLEQGPYHAGLQRFVQDLNRLYRAEPALWESDFDLEGFFWVDCSDQESSVLSFVRQTREGSGRLLVLLNLTPVVRSGYRVGLPQQGFWREVLNTDAAIYGGSNQGNCGGLWAEPTALHNHPWSAPFTLPPLAVTVFRCEPDGPTQP
jgi:1,4-alpha-glucan branching enzyme